MRHGRDRIAVHIMVNIQKERASMGESIEERVAGFTVEFVNKVTEINEELIYDNYYMHCGKKKFMLADIARDELTAEDCLSYMHEDHKLDVKEFTDKDDCVAYMMCEGYLYEKMYGYDAYQRDIYGDGDEAKRLYDAVFRIAEKYSIWFNWHGGALVFYDKVYTVINELLKYEFNDGERTECPIVVLGPDGSTTTMFRIYAYGGLIGRIATGYGKTHLAENKNYSRYLSEKYLSNDDEIDKRYLRCMNDKYVRLENDRIEYSESMVCSKLRTRLEEILDEPYDWYLDYPEYLDLILKAVEKKFMNTGKKLGERRIETAIVKRHMKKDAKADWCVIDMEYTVSKKLNPAGKKFNPDIVVFDNIRGFGFIELKYDNKSADNLPEHYDDVQNIIRDKEAVQKITKELKRRSSYLRDYGLIDDTLYKSMQNSHNLWQGFLFVGGKRENTVNLVKNSAKFGKDQNCRFAFYPYDEKHSADCIGKIKLDYQSMQTYDEFIGMI